MVVGAPFADRLAPLPRVFSSGAAYVYTRPNANSDFVLLQALDQPTILANNNFGFAVAISNGVIFVSAPGHENGTVADHGAILTFTKGTTGKYTLAATLFDAESATTTTGAFDRLGSTNTGGFGTCCYWARIATALSAACCRIRHRN